MQFLDHIKCNSCMPSNALICFKGQTIYPLLFFSYLFSYIKRNSCARIVHVDLSEVTKAVICAQLETGFLAGKTYYWFHNLSLLDIKSKNWWLTYVQKYRGPHCIIFFVDQNTKLKILGDDVLIVEVQDAIGRHSFEYLFQFFNESISSANKRLITLLFQKYENLSLDKAMMLIYYTLFAGSGSSSFVRDWLDLIIVPEKSLFTLSTYFFSRNIQEFFKFWRLISLDYPDVFWISFWSDLIWRACNVVQLLQKKCPDEARHIGFRLPFSFLQRDWKKVTLKELQQAHQFLYELDFSAKNGFLTLPLELFYTKFFLHQFEAV